MKICVISFDFWGYDQHIVDTLCSKGIDAHHIKIGNVTHTNFQERVVNALSKIIFNKNLKTEKRKQYVLDTLNQLGNQDQILVLNPDIFDISTLKEIKKHTNKLITYLYDSLDRFPVEKDKLKLFDKIFSFDISDVQKFGFEKLTNYIYIPYLSNEHQSPEMDLFYITSYDAKRVSIIKILVQKLIELNLKFQILVIGKKGWKHQVKNIFRGSKNVSLIFSIKKINHKDVAQYYKNSKALLDLTRENQCGLSFRVFEAMALEKKIITDNENIKKYDFYNPKNILILNDNCSNLNISFFESPYEKVPDDIYKYYTLDSWVERVFKL